MVDESWNYNLVSYFFSIFSSSQVFIVVVELIKLFCLVKLNFFSVHFQ